MMTDMEMDLILANAEIKRLKEENEYLKSIIASELIPAVAESLPGLIEGVLAAIPSIISKKCIQEGDLNG